MPLAKAPIESGLLTLNNLLITVIKKFYIEKATITTIIKPHIIPNCVLLLYNNRPYVIVIIIVCMVQTIQHINAT